jgi:hypothetical protein
MYMNGRMKELVWCYMQKGEIENSSSGQVIPKVSNVTARSMNWVVRGTSAEQKGTSIDWIECVTQISGWMEAKAWKISWS